MTFRVGDKVVRLIAESSRQMLKVTAVNDNTIVCGPWVFDRETGCEIDEACGWGKRPDGTWYTGSRLLLEE